MLILLKNIFAGSGEYLDHHIIEDASNGGKYATLEAPEIIQNLMKVWADNIIYLESPILV